MMKAGGVLVGAMLLAVAGVPAEAQQRGPRGAAGPDPAMMIERLTEELGLTEVQAAALRPMFDSMAVRRRAAFDEHRGNRTAMRQAMQVIRTDTDRQLASILTADQMQKFRQWRARQERRGGG